MKANSSSASVSVVIPCFRCSSTIGRAIASINNQTQKPAEVILVDDGSGDETLKILERIALEYPDLIKVISSSVNRGAASARNAGWASSSQPYIAFLDSDDVWHPKKIEIQYRFMVAHPEIVMSGHAHRELYFDDRTQNWNVETWKSKSISKNNLLLKNCFITPSIMLKRELPFRFSEGKRYMEDHLLWLQIASSQSAIAKLSAELAAIYKSSYGASGLSADMWSMELGELQNYRQLYKCGSINFFLLLGLIIYSVFKFVRRLVLYWGFIRWKRLRRIF
jgi:glycosyltransferase involved in cell wall biosynthesis